MLIVDIVKIVYLVFLNLLRPPKVFTHSGFWLRNTVLTMS